MVRNDDIFLCIDKFISETYFPINLSLLPAATPNGPIFDPSPPIRTGLHSIELSGNPWRCDCRLRALKRWLVAANVPLTEDAGKRKCTDYFYT